MNNMNINNFKNKILFSNKKTHKFSSGFTLIETMVSIFILTIALSAFMSVVASSLFTARYANNEITANYLLQEAVDGIRNERDTAFQRQVLGLGSGWFLFREIYGGNNSSKCFTTNGCDFEVKNISRTIAACGSTCRTLIFDTNATNGSFYNYGSIGTNSVFKRKIVMSVNANNYDQIDITVTVNWSNGNKPRSRILKASLTNWQQ